MRAYNLIVDAKFTICFCSTPFFRLSISSWAPEIFAVKVDIYPKFPRCTISLYCERNNLLFSTFLMHSIWWNMFNMFNSVICDILFDGSATSGIGLQRPALTNVDWLHWLSCYIFTRESSYCFHRFLAIAILSVRLSVCPSVRPSHGWISQKRCKLGLPNFHRRLHGTIVKRPR